MSKYLCFKKNKLGDKGEGEFDFEDMSKLDENGEEVDASMMSPAVKMGLMQIDEDEENGVVDEQQQQQHRANSKNSKHNKKYTRKGRD